MAKTLTTSIVPNTRSKAREKELSRGDVEFRADLEEQLWYNPIARLGYDPSKVKTMPQEIGLAAMYFPPQNSKRSVERMLEKDTRLVDPTARGAERVYPDDTVFFSGTAQSPIISHEFTHRGIAQLIEYYKEDPEFFEKTYGHLAAMKLEKIANIFSDEDEGFTELFDDYDALLNVPSSPIRRMGDTRTASWGDEQEEFQKYIAKGKPEDRLSHRRYAAEVGLIKAAEDLLKQRGEPPKAEPVIEKPLGFRYAEGGLTPDVDRQTRDAFGNISGPMMPPRAEEAFIPTPKKEDVFGNTISKMSAESFSKAWEAATKAGTIDVNENDPRLLTAFKQANQYIADMAAAGLYTAQGGFEAAAGAIGEVFGGSPQSEMRFARDIAGMGEAFAGSGVSRGANLLDDLIESSVTAVKAATPGKLQADVVGQMRSLLDGDKEFRTESKKSAQGLSAQAVSKPESRIPFFKKKELRTDTNSPDAAFGTKRVRDLFEEDQLDAFEPFDVEEVPGLGDETGWDLSSEGYSFNKLGYARNIAIDSLARYKLGQIDLTELADQVGTDVTESFKEYVNARLNRLSNNPDFVDYTQKLERDLSFNPWDLVSKDTFDQGVGKTIFRSPIPEALGEMNWPNKGKEGYQILSELQKNPSVRKSELDTVISEIDPKKRYSLEEVQDLIKDNLWDTEVKVFSGFDTKWESYQRQRDLEDPETDYFELTIDSKRENKPNFKPRGQHFDESTLAHARASVRENSYTGKPYILGEEFQTDLIQKGYDPQQTAKPRVLPEEAIKNTAAARKEGGLFTDKADELLLQVLAEDYRYDLFYNSPAIKNFIEEVGPEKLLNKPGATTKDVLDSLSIYQASDLLNLYANYKTGKPGSINIVNNDDAWDVVYSFKDYYWNVLDKEINYDDIPATSLPPVKKIEETVKMTLGALISEAAKRNIDTIVIPPLERILEKRFFPGSDDFNNAMSPKSGFYKTYVKSVRSAIEDFEKEFGRNNISSRLIDMDYKDKNLPITGTEIYFRGLLDSGYDLTKPRLAEGGLTMDEQMNKLFAEGGVNTGNAKVDPVSGNEVPPGSMPREVRDDIDAKLSGGEYVVPADVLRYYGVAFFEKLRAKAKAGLEEMNADGRIGGGMPEEEDDFPFSVDELQTEEVGFAEGGMTTPTPSPTGTFNPSDWSFNGSFDGGGGMDQIQVKKYQDKDGNVVNVLFINGKPVVDVNALGYTEYKEETPVGTGEEVKAPEAPRESDRDRAPPEPPKERTPVDPAENYYNLSEADLLNPNYSTTFGKNAGTIAKAGTLLAGPGIGLGVGLINGFQEASNLADARARAIIAKERGFDTTELDKFIKDMEANASGFVKAADFVGLDGKNIVKNMQNDLGTYKPATGTAPQTGGSRSTSGGGSKTYGGGSGVATTPKESSADRDSGYTAPSASSGSSGAKIGYSSDVTKGATIAHSYTGDTKLGYSPSITEGKTAASTPTKASDYKPAATDISKGSTSSLNEDYGTVGSARGGRAKGGLVEKPQKVAKPKTRRKTKI